MPAIFRQSFFELLGKKCDLYVSASQPLENESIKTFGSLKNCVFIRSQLLYLLGGRLWFDRDWKRNIDRLSPDVVILTPTPRMVSNFLVVWYCKRKKIKVMGWGMGKMPGLLGFKATIHLFLLRKLLKPFDSMIAYSTEATKYYTSAGISVSRCYTAFNSIDTNESHKNLDLLTKETSVKQDLSKLYGVSETSLKIVFVGRLTKSKKIDSLFGCLDKLNLDCELIVVGDGIYKETLVQRAQESIKKILFVGHLSGYELARLLYICDLFVLPALGGLAVQQAMSYGLPIVVSVGDGTEQDLVESGVNGLFFVENDEESMFSAISEIIHNHDLALMGRKSLVRIEETYNINNMIDSFEKALDETFYGR